MGLLLTVNLTLALLLGMFAFSVLTPSGHIPVRRRKP